MTIVRGAGKCITAGGPPDPLMQLCILAIVGMFAALCGAVLYSCLIR